MRESKGCHRANCSRLWFRVGEEEGGTGKGHFLEAHGFEGCCFIKLGRFHVVKEPVESEGRKREQRAGWGRRPYVDEGGVGGYSLLAGCEKEGKTSEEESFLSLGWAFLRSGWR